MIISQVKSTDRHVKSATDSNTVKTANSSIEAKETTAGQNREDAFIRTKTSEKIEATDYRSLKRLNGSQLKALKDQRAESMQRLVTEMMGKQAAKAKAAFWSKIETLSDTTVNAQNSWMSQFLGPQDTPETAAQAIAKDGEWGVNAVATRLLDMAVSLSGGDVSKIAELRSAVEAGFKAAGDVIGGELPGICQDTYTETMNRFDYWAQNGSMDGYVMKN